jgi:hypothetical protein
LLKTGFYARLLYPLNTAKQYSITPLPVQIPMRILIDKDVLFAEEAFSTIGNVEVESGNLINNSLVQNADVLIIRTVP